MQNIVLDIGNTLYKLALFEDRKLLEVLETESEEACLAQIEKYEAKHILISSVRRNVALLAQQITSKKVFVLDHHLPVPIKNKYQSPETLGMDRLAAAIGAKSFFPDKPCLVVDLGTCVTYDFVSAENEFLGGMIAPGVRMRLAAMHQFTQKLPLIDWQPEQEVPIIGKNTQEAILSGAVNGVKAEIYSLRVYYQTLYPDLQTILCGGDSTYFENIKKGNTFALPKLVLYGLNQILLYQLANVS
ncbi:MAG: type III pantothenate kinase [Raineya sp.]